MKILFAAGIYPPESGGPARYTQSLASALTSRGHVATVLAYGERSGRTIENGVSIVRVSRSGGPVLRYLRYAWYAFRLARTSDFVYAQGGVSEGFPATIGASLAGRRVVMRIPGDYAWEMAQQKGEKDLLDAFLTKRHRGVVGFYERVERWTTRKAWSVITPSRYLKSVVEKWGVPSERIDVVHNANEPMPATRGRDEERRAFDVADRVVILTVVRALPWKGVGELIEWWKALPTTHTLVVADIGPELERWKALAVTHGVADRVRFVGRMDRAALARWYAAADAFVLHSGYEGYSHVVTEAASFGLPCFVSDQGGNPETALDFPELVHVLPYKNKEAWVEELSRITQHVSRITHSAASWTHAQMIETTERLLKETIEPSQGNMQTVIVSYDRELLDAATKAFDRVMSLGDHLTSLNIIVLQGRIWRPILDGIRGANRLPGRTIVTAQDPFATGVVGYVVSRWTNSPLEVQEHGDFFSGEWVKESWKNRFWSLVGRFVLRRAERVRVVSERVKQHVVALGVSAEKIEVIPVAMDLASIRMPSFAHALLSAFRIVAPCRFVEQKGLDVLLDAAAVLKTRGRDFRLSLVGAGPLEAWLRRRIEERGLTDRVTLEPWRSSDSLWEAADLFVLSSRYEGFGRTIVEAMSAGVPVVTTDVGCVGSVFRPGVDGLVVPVNDATKLADAIVAQMTDDLRREQMRQSARAQSLTLPTRDALHDRQRHGWRALLSTKREVGPRWDLWILSFVLFVILSRAASVILFHSGLLQREYGFFRLVQHWFQGYGYSYASELGCASAYRSPAYLFFLTALYSIFSPDNTWAQAIAQNLFVVGLLVLVYVVGKKFVGKRAALVAGFLMAAYPYTFYHYTQYYHTFLSSFFLLALVWAVMRLRESKRSLDAVIAGVFIACLAYVQGTILAATPFIVLWLFWIWKWDWRATFKAALVMGLVSAAVIAPWTYRNYLVFHRFVPLTTDLGFGLFKANNENIYALTERGYPQEVVDVETVSSTNPGYVQYRMEPNVERDLAQAGVLRPSVMWTEWHPKDPSIGVTTCVSRGPMDEVAYNAYWTAKATDWIRANFWTEDVKLMALKFRTFWQPALFPSVKMGAAWTFAGNSTKEWLARNATTAASSIVIFGGAVGILFALRRRDRRVWLPIAILLVYTLLHMQFAGYTKYRIPLDQLMAIYAGWTLVAAWDWFRGIKK